MASVSATIEQLSVAPGVVDDLRARLEELANRALPLPGDALAGLEEQADGIAPPDAAALFGAGAGRLQALAAEGLRAPEDLLGPVGASLDRLAGGLADGLAGLQEGAFAPLRELESGLPVDAEALLAAAAGPLRDLVGALAEEPALQHVAELAAKVEELRAQLEAAPAQLGALLAEQLSAAVDEATEPLRPVEAQLERILGSVEARMLAAALAGRLDEAVLLLVPEGAPGLAERLAAVDLASAQAVLAVQGDLAGARVLLERTAAEAHERAGAARELLEVLDPSAWGARLLAGAAAASEIAVTNAGAALAPWRDALRRARDAVGDVRPDALLAPLRDAVDEVVPVLEGIDAAALAEALAARLQGAAEAADAARRTGTEVLAGVRALADEIAATLGAIDPEAIAATVEGALASVDAALGAIEEGLDAVAGPALDGLEALRADLAALHADLTDPAGPVRAPLETFLAAVRDAVPADIPERLAAAGAALGDAVAGLDEVALDPPFDAAVAQLEEMRAELAAIDAGSLDALLRAALAAALAVFRAFDFEGEVEELLVTRFDEAVASVSDPAVEAIQAEVDRILELLRANDPAVLFERLGVADAFDALLDHLAGLNPAALLAGTVQRLRAAAARLEAFTPAAALEPIRGPLEKLRSYADELTLEPVAARLRAALDRLGALLDELALEPFAAALDEAFERVRGRLEALLTADGLLEVLRPVHAAALDAVRAADPAEVLAPVTAFRDVLLDAIDAVDASAVSGALEQVAARVEGVRLDGLRTRALAGADRVLGGLAALDLPGRLEVLEPVHGAARQALEDRGVQADPEAERRRQDLLAAVAALDPLPLLARAAAEAGALERALAELRASLGEILRDAGPLEAPLDALADRLRELALGIDAGAPDLKARLRAAVEEAYRALGTQDLADLHGALRAAVEGLAPEALEEALDELLAPVRDLLGRLAPPSEQLAPALEAFEQLAALVDPGLRDFLTELEARVAPVLEAVRDAARALDPAPLVAALGERYERITALAGRLLGRLDDAVARLGGAYEQIVALIDALDPRTVLVEPLAATWGEVLGRVEGVEVRAVFQPLLDAIGGLRDDLLAHLRRTREAFEGFLGAAPAGAGVSL